MSWSASLIGGRVHNLLRFDGLFISRRSNVLSFRVGLSVTKKKKDLKNTLTTINNIYEKSDTNILWNTFKNDIINSIESNIPHKLFTYKQRLPWINNNLGKLINKKNKYYRKKN
jgi:hypothetical protein